MTTSNPSHYTSTRQIVKEYKTKGLRVKIFGVDYIKDIPKGWSFVFATMPSPVMGESIDRIIVAFSRN